ncbi:hypothetical protein PM082_003644 [Marasmius tenuissimus]|nr:hypothetical protein PM082_003644 [Marasmius tenuissimus]
MLLVERTYQLAEPGTPQPRQVFVTQSRILAKKVKEYFKTLARALHVSTQSSDQLSELQDIAAEEEEDDNIALDDIKDWYKDLPSKFSQLEDRHFPLFVTYSTLCSMLEADMTEKSLETSALMKGGADTVARIGSISHSSAAVDFDCFVKKYWPSLPEPLTKRIDPSLAFSELIGVIKGSEETLMCQPHLLPPEAYAKKSEGRHATFAAHGGQIYALYEAYAKKKKQAGARDVADRTHILLDYLNSHGVPGRKIDQLYVDEVQDNLLIDTLALRALCINPNGLFWAGDTAQAISAGSSFSFNELRAFQWRLEEKRLASFSPGGLLPSVNKAEIFQLAVNYRSHAGIVDCAHSVIDLINRFWPGSIDGLAREQGMTHGPQPIFFDGKGSNASVLSKYLFGDSGNRIEFGAQQCILVRDADAKERLKEEMGDDVGLILTIYDSKGLEFNDILLYNFFEDSNADFARWRVVLNAIGQSSVPLPKFDNNKHASIWLDLKFLYVALTRARENVWIADVSNKGEPMREYWTSRGLIRSMTPGVDAPQLASSSTPEEWVVRGKQFFHLKKYREARQCFERAKKPNYVLMAEAYMTYDLATGAKPGPRRKAAFHSAAAAFRRCSETFKTRHLEYLRLSARCFREAQEFQEAAELLLEIRYYGEAVECYLEVSMFDEAVKIVLGYRDQLESSLADKTIKKAKFYYLSSADSLPSSDPQRKIHLKQGCQLFDDSEDPVEYLEDRLLSGALGDVLVAAQRLDEAAELHWSEGRMIEAISLLFENQTEASSRRAAEYVLEGFWQMLPFGTPTSESNGDLARLLDLASSVNTKLMDFDGRQELLMFRNISSPDTDAAALRAAGKTFLDSKNFPAALLCLYRYFENLSVFEDPDLSLEVLARELDLFHLFAEHLTATVTMDASGVTDVSTRLLGYRRSSDGQVRLLPHSPLYHRFIERYGSGRVHEVTSVDVQTLTRDIVFARLGFLTNRILEDCKTIKALSICLQFARAGYCNRWECPRVHVHGLDLNDNMYTLRVRVHLQLVLLLTKFQHNTPYRQKQRRHWLRRTYEAFHPPHHAMGGMANLKIDLLPESHRDRIGKIKYWIEGFLYSQDSLSPSFLSLLLCGAIMALDTVPSLASLVESRSLIHDDEASRYLHRGTWTSVAIPPAFLRAGGGNSIHELLSALEASTQQSLTKGIFALRHIVQKRLTIDICVLCDFLDNLCKNLVISRFCHYHGRNIHSMTLPRSWLMTIINVDLCRDRSFQFLPFLIEPMANLLAQIYTGNDADHLLLEKQSLSSPIPGPIRSIFITRICRALALLAYNFRRESLEKAVLSTTTSLRDLNPPPPPSVPYKWYVYSDDWRGIVGTVRRSASGSPMDEMVELLHRDRLPSGVIVNQIPFVRRLVYDRLENVPSLLRQTESHPLPAVAEQSTLEQQVVEEHVQAHEQDDPEEDHMLNVAPIIPVDDEHGVEPHTEEERQILSKLPTIYRENLWRLRKNATAIAERRQSIFLSCRLQFQKIPSNKYRKMVLGPLPHLLACLEILYVRLLDHKNKLKHGRPKVSNHVELEELENALTSTNSAIKKVTSLQRFMGPGSGIHIARSEDILKRYVQELGELISNSLPVGLDTEMQEEFDIGWKGIVKPAFVPSAKPEKPKLNTSDCLELAFT